MAVARHYSLELVDSVQGMIDEEGEVGALSIWQRIIEKLWEAKILYYEACVGPDLVLCLPSNPGGLGLNPFQVHKTGADIMRIGCNPDELNRIVAFDDRCHISFHFHWKWALINRQKRSAIVIVLLLTTETMLRVR